MGFRTSDRHFPRVVLLEIGGPTDEAEVDRFFEWHRGIYEREERHCLLSWIRRDTRADARIRAKMARGFEALLPWSSRLMIASAVVVDSTLARGLFTAVSWLNPPPHPQRWMATSREAVDFLDAHLRLEGLTPLEDVERAHIRVFFEGVASEAS